MKKIIIKQKNPVYWLTYDDIYISQQRRQAEFFVPFQVYDEDKMISDCIDRVEKSKSFAYYYLNEKEAQKKELKAMLKAFCAKVKNEIQPIDEAA